MGKDFQLLDFTMAQSTCKAASHPTKMATPSSLLLLLHLDVAVTCREDSKKSCGDLEVLCSLLSNALVGSLSDTSCRFLQAGGLDSFY